MTKGAGNLIKNDNFRLIFVTKSVLILTDLKVGFNVIVVDDEKINEEELNEALQRKKPMNDFQIEKISRELIEAGFNGDLESVKRLIS